MGWKTQLLMIFGVIALLGFLIYLYLKGHLKTIQAKIMSIIPSRPSTLTSTTPTTTQPTMASAQTQGGLISLYPKPSGEYASYLQNVLFETPSGNWTTYQQNYQGCTFPVTPQSDPRCVKLALYLTQQINRMTPQQYAQLQQQLKQKGINEAYIHYMGFDKPYNEYMASSIYAEQDPVGYLNSHPELYQLFPEYFSKGG